MLFSVFIQRTVKDRGLYQQVRYLGKKYGRDKNECLDRADIFAFPTFYPNECFPLVLLEAMQHHLPIVTTLEGGIPDIVKNNENGLISPQNDSVSLADCLVKLLNDKELRLKMGEDGYRKFKTHFTLQEFEKGFTNIMSMLTPN